jgi:glycosyltransferase involved in cell wall biosynthesis
MSKNILMAVEPNFNVTHVGVKRVIRYYWERLVAVGHSVTLAAPISGRLVSCSSVDAAQAVLTDDRKQAHEAPTWKSGDKRLEALPESPKGQRKRLIKWTGDFVRAEGFDASILTNPWLCVHDGVPLEEQSFSVGIVYDMVPNLIALGVLRMPQFMNVYKFAYEHGAGYEFYIKNAQKITCISESTKRDFLSIYGSNLAHKLDVCLPFSDFGNGIVRKTEEARDVLLINVLDHRKNFSTVAKTLKEAASKRPLNVIVAGRERMAFQDVIKFLEEISAVCSNVEWYRSPSDAQLEELMKQAKVLFFPSIYEGLGLPILEAQAKGIPVISSSSSSCAEINLNPDLTADPYDYKTFASKLVDILSGEVPVSEGTDLRSKQVNFLQDKNQLTITF